MKSQHFLYLKALNYCLLSLLALLAGCAVTTPPQPVIPTVESSLPYRSELTDPDAKALFSFLEFKIHGAEDRWEDAISALNSAINFDPNSEYLRLLLAKAYLHRQQPEQAAATLDVLLERNFESVEGHQLMGDVLSYQRDFTSAADHFRLALNIDPSNSPLQLRLSMALAQLGRKDEAIDVLEKFLLQQPEASLAQLYLARLYLDKKQIDKASSVYRELLKNQPGQQQAVLEYGKILERQDPDAAQELYEKFLEENPRAAGVRRQLAEYYLTQQLLEESLEQFQGVHQQFPDNQQIIMQIGLIQLELKDWIEAEKSFRILLNSDNQLERGRYYLAMALSGQEKREEAIAVLEHVGPDSSFYAEAALQLAYLYKQNQQNDKAIALLSQMLDQNIHHPEVYYYLVAFLGDRGDLNQAVEVALRGVEENPEATQLLYQLGVLYEKQVQRQMAVETMEKILLLDDAHADALNFLAYDQAENETDLDLALSRAKKALETNPSGYIVDTLGWVYFKMGRYSESRKHLEKAVQLYPEDAVIQEHLGDLYFAMKLLQQAESAYRRALELNPEATQVEEKLKQLTSGDF
ncbi:tetratricopeptide repeat protein [uncultured Desulfuromusa sp.]|uniref:tetratricopeptide repeat protein n=1 Tax=uncultured Desulfuromusa sp. TaxID=219183 RepID=UPI002AA6774A|nr:tetratricopeptide repeat protein [uncultured Desulfuromusa sp.]